MRNPSRYSSAVFFAVLITACSHVSYPKPAFPDEQAVRDRFKVDYRETQCELVKIHPPEGRPDQASEPFVYVHIRFDARCIDLDQKIRDVSRKQVWQRSRERLDLVQGAWTWTTAGEISY